jgi:Uma2 family endonuclease
MISRIPKDPELEWYPSNDGNPMSDNTLQFQWIVVLQGNLDVLFQANPNVFVAGDLLWYPVRGQPTIRIAPDTIVVLGRPKGHRSSYLQWREDNIPPQVVFEVLSPGNTAAEMERKLGFYDQYGVLEYYLYDPDDVRLWGWERNNGHLQPIEQMDGWRSPRLGIRFDLSSAPQLVIYRDDGHRFLTFLELAAQSEEREHQTEEALQIATAAQRRYEDGQQGTAEAQRQAEEARRDATDAQRQAHEAQQGTVEAQRQAEEARREASDAQRRSQEAQHLAEEARRDASDAQRQAHEAQQGAAEAQRQAEEARRQAQDAERELEQTRRKAERLAKRLRALGIDPEVPENGAN